MIKPVSAVPLFDTLMRVLGDDAAAPTRRRTERCRRPRPARTCTGARVLLVEDNELNQQVARELLQEAGFMVDIAANGQEAVDMAEPPDRYDLVLMDMQMPVMDGLEATAPAARRSATWRDLPIVAMTANALEADRERCLDAGMNDHLAKPIEPCAAVAGAATLDPAAAGGRRRPPCRRQTVAAAADVPACRCPPCRAWTGRWACAMPGQAGVLQSTCCVASWTGQGGAADPRGRGLVAGAMSTRPSA